MSFVSGGHIWLLLILLVVVLIIWGPGKLPEVGSGMGRAIREFRKASADTREEFAKATQSQPDSAPVSPIAAATPVVATPAAAPSVAPVVEPFASTPAAAVAPVAPVPVSVPPSENERS